MNGARFTLTQSGGVVPQVPYPQLWMLLSVALATLCLLGTALDRRREGVRRSRLTALLGPRRDGVVTKSTRWRRLGGLVQPDGVRRRSLRDGAAALGAAAMCLALVGGVVGFLLGLAVAYAVAHWLRRRETSPEQSADPATERQAVAQLPLAAELLAACLAAGSGPGEAAAAVGDSLGGPLGERLTRASAELRLGAEPAVVWSRFGALPGAAALARRLERAGTTGVPAVAAMARLAADYRAQRTRLAQLRARRAAVLVAGPLGLCFLPAFLLVGVAPVVMGLARSLL